MLSVLARLGTVTDSEPALLLLRANAAAPLGRLDQVIDDVDRAAALAEHADPPVRRRVEAAVARTEFFRGHRDEAIALATQRSARHRSRRGAHVRPRPRGARPGDGGERDPRRPAARRRVVPRRGRGVGRLRRERPGPQLPMRPGDGRAHPARTLRRGARRARPGARRRRAQRRRALLADDLRGVRPARGQPPRPPRQDASIASPTSATSRTTRRSSPRRRGAGR